MVNNMEYTSLPSSSTVAATSQHDAHIQYPANLHLNSSSTRRDSIDSNEEFSLPPPSPMHVPAKKLIFGFDKQKLYTLFKQFTNSRLFLLITIYIGGLVLLSFITIFKGSELVKFLTWSKESIQKHTKLGTVILFAFCFISCFPPFIGHGFAGLFAGYIFGLWKGFLIIYPSTVLGILGCYWMGRLMFYSQVQSLLKEYPTIKKVDRRIATDGIKLVVLLRLGTYPFSWLNLMFSAISIPFYQYFWIVLAIDVRVILTIYIGTTLDSLLDIFHSGIRGNKAQLFGFIVGMAFMVISSVYTVIYFRRCLKEGDAAEELVNEGLANSGAGLGEEFDVPLMRIEDSQKGEKIY